MTALTENALAFARANAVSPVVAGACTHNGPERPENVTGAHYELADGRSFTLTSEELRSLPEPRWSIS